MAGPTSTKPCIHQSESEACAGFLVVDCEAALAKLLTLLWLVLGGLAFATLQSPRRVL